MVVAERQPVRYAISDLSFGAQVQGLDAAADRRMRWQTALHRWAPNGVDFVQLREKILEGGELLTLAKDAMAICHGLGDTQHPPAHRPKVLLNGRPDIAAAACADGVHLTSRPGELHPAQAREVFHAAGLPHCLVSVSCHTLPEVTAARQSGADLILFGPVFEKRVGTELVSKGVGLPLLAEACRCAGTTPVLALGGLTADNLQSCLQVGATGVAGIRLFG